MSTTKTRTEGKGEELGGKLKAGVGKLIGNEQMQAEGRAHELSGKAKQEAAKSAERTKGKVQEAVGTVKAGVGRALDDPSIEAGGRAKELEGEPARSPIVADPGAAARHRGGHAERRGRAGRVEMGSQKRTARAARHGSA